MTSRAFDFHFKRWGEKRNGLQQYKIFYQGKHIGNGMRSGNRSGEWWVMPFAWSKGVGGFRTKWAATEFIQQYYLDDPWRDDSSTQGYSEFSVDRKTWTRSRTPESRYMRFVGVSLSIELRNHDD